MNKSLDRSYRKAFTTAVFFRSSTMMTSFIDGILTSIFLGADAMTAYGIATPYFMMNTVLSYALITGGQILCSSKIGKNRTGEAENVFSTAIWFLFTISAFVSVAGIVFAEPFARFLGARGDAAYLAPMAAGYLRFLFSGNIFHNFVALSSGILQMDGGAKLVRASGITACVTDIVGDLLNIFLFKGGLAGMGAATALSYAGSAAVLLLYFFRRSRLFSLCPKHIRSRYIPELFRLGSSQMVYAIASFFGSTAINRLIISRAGLDVMLGMTVFKNIVLFANPFCCAVGDATLLLMGLRIGECDRKGVDQVFRDSLRIILRLIPAGLILMLLSRPLAYLYVSDGTAAAVGCVQTAIIALGVQIPFTALFLASAKGLQAFRNSVASSLVNLAKACILPCGLLLIFAGLNSVGVFGSLVGAEILSAVLSTALFHKERTESSLLCIPEKNIIRAEISTDAAAVGFSEEVSKFCAENNLSSKLCYFIPLCVEELSIYLINQGTDNKSIASGVTVKVVRQDYRITVCFIDNNPLNDLQKRAEEWSLHDEHPEKFIGMRIALKLAYEFKYIPLMDQNNTILTFEIS